MAESRVHELLSGLVVTLRSSVVDAKRIHQGLLDSRGARKYLDSSSPQVIIYTRKVHGNCGHTFISDNIVSQLGYAAKDFVEDSSSWDRNIHPDDVQKVSTRLAKLFETGHMVQEYRFRHKDGRYRWLRDEFNLIKDDHGAPSEILGSCIDVTERRRVEQALREGEARYRSLVDNAPMGMISFDKNGEITEFNPAVLSILGASHLEVADARDLFSLLPLVEAGISEAIVQCLESGESGVGEFQYKSKVGRDVYARVHVVPIRDDEKKITGAHAFLMDISDQKRAEELIVGSERLKVLGQISNGVGHTFSNLLQIVSGNANMAMTNLDLKDLENAKANLDQIVESTKSATEAVRWLQQFARGRAGTATQKQETFDLAEAVEEAVEMCKLWSKSELEWKKIKIEHELELTRGCHVEGIPDQIAWVALNILKNAVEAMPKGGKIRTKTYVKDRNVILSVQDSGIGIPPKDIRNITTAFWTSKEAHAGMGLPFSCGILRTHGGTLGVKRAKPRGSMFMVRLPYVSALTKRTGKENLGKGLRILFVDDDERIVKVFQRGFRGTGPHDYSCVLRGAGFNDLSRIWSGRDSVRPCNARNERMGSRQGSGKTLHRKRRSKTPLHCADRLGPSTGRRRNTVESTSKQSCAKTRKSAVLAGSHSGGNRQVPVTGRFLWQHRRHRHTGIYPAVALERSPGAGGDSIQRWRPGSCIR